MSCKPKKFKPTVPGHGALPFGTPTDGLPGMSDRLEKKKFGKPPVPQARRPRF